MIIVTKAFSLMRNWQNIQMEFIMESKRWKHVNFVWFWVILCQTWQAKMQLSLCDTVWKFHNFSTTQNLREIDFGDFRSAKSTILTHFEALNSDFLYFCTFWRLKYTEITKLKAAKIAKMAVLELLDSQKLISCDRKIKKILKHWSVRQNNCNVTTESEHFKLKESIF